MSYADLDLLQVLRYDGLILDGPSSNALQCTIWRRFSQSSVPRLAPSINVRFA
jgi:hypothetical protein